MRMLCLGNLLAAEDFVPWSDAYWTCLLEAVLASRFDNGMSETRVTLRELAQDIRKMPKDRASLQELAKRAQKITDNVSDEADSQMQVHRPRKHSISELAQMSRSDSNSDDSVKQGVGAVSNDTKKMSISLTDKLKLSAEKKPLTKQQENQGSLVRDETFEQVSWRFFKRPYFKAPGNLDKPMERSTSRRMRHGPTKRSSRSWTSSGSWSHGC